MARIDDIKGTNELFKVPQNYFEDLSSEIRIKILEDGLKEDYGSKAPFSVPKGYFESIDPESYKIPKKSIVHFLKPYISIAAGIILIAGIWQIVAVNLDLTDGSTSNLDTSKDKDSLYAEFVVDLTTIDTIEIEKKAELYLYEMDNESVYGISESDYQKTSETGDQDESIYDYFVDYDSGLDYIDFLTE
jgi:hypothetical protein